MKAIVRTRYGGAEVLKLKDVEKPVPGDNEVLVKVYITSVNRTDCGFHRAKPWIVRFFSGIFVPKVKIPGSEFAGVIEEVGGNVSSFSKGDRVFGFYDEGIQSWAEYTTVSVDKQIATIPKGLSFEYGLVEGAHYAYNFLNNLDVKKGQKILVNGATGAIGSSAVQILKFLEVSVTAVCGTRHVKLVKSLGADKVIDYQKEDFTMLNEEFDFVFDTVGKSRFSKCKPILKKNGVYLSSELGPRCENVYLPLITKIIGGKKVVFPIPTARSIDFLKELMEKGKFKPVIDRAYSMKEVGKAFSYVEKGMKTGNVVIQVHK